MPGASCRSLLQACLKSQSKGSSGKVFGDLQGMLTDLHRGDVGRLKQPLKLNYNVCISREDIKLLRCLLGCLQIALDWYVWEREQWQCMRLREITEQERP